MFCGTSATKSKHKRLAAGWAGEEIVISALERVIPNQIKPITHVFGAADTGKQKTDAIIHLKEQNIRTQIKSREAGDDIIVEWFKIYPQVEGRDKVTLAQAYAVLTHDHSWLYFLDAKKVKNACRVLEREWLADGSKRTYFSTQGHEVILQNSYDFPNESKLMMFLKPSVTFIFANKYKNIIPKYKVPQDIM